MKEQLVRKYAELTGASLKDSKTAIDATVNSIIALLEEEGSVSIWGFGSFELVEKAESVARNPKNGEEVIVPAHKKLKVKMSDSLKKRLR